MICLGMFGSECGVEMGLGVKWWGGCIGVEVG